MHQRVGFYALIVAMGTVMPFMVMMVMMIMVMVVVNMGSLFAEPAPHVGGFGRRIVETAVEQCRPPGFRPPGIEHPSPGIDLPQARPQRGEVAVTGGQIGLGEHDAVGHGDLLDRLDMRIERSIAV